MKAAAILLTAALLLSSCTSSYPYLVTNNDCNCERFVFRDSEGRFQIGVSARYSVGDRIHTVMEFEFRNSSRLPLSLKQAFLKGSSLNIHYEFNDRFQPMPYVVIPPSGTYMLTLEGSDVETTDDPWLKIAGEKVVIEMKGMLLGSKPLAPVILTFRPINPRLTP